MTVISTRDGSLKCELGKYLGEGRDGVCYRVINNNLGLDDMVLKIMFESQRASQIFQHIERLLTKAKRSFCEISSLECLLVTPFISEQGKCCLLMPRAQGTTLTDLIENKDIIRLPLRKRVRIAHQIALGIKSLHSVRIIHADIAGPNIIIDTSRMRAFVIDIDGGGLVGSIAPRIKGHHGDWMAPELQSKNSPPPNQSSDCWSLAVVLHGIITGLSPFYFCSTMQEIPKYARDWPPSPTKVSRELQEWALWHRRILDQMGDIAVLFKRTFSTGQGNPKARPPASEWELVLREYLGKSPRATKRCLRCGTENAPESIYCHNENCAAILHRSLYKCHHCSRLVPINAMFCPECGSKQVS